MSAENISAFVPGGVVDSSAALGASSQLAMNLEAVESVQAVAEQLGNSIQHVANVDIAHNNEICTLATPSSSVHKNISLLLPALAPVAVVVAAMVARWVHTKAYAKKTSIKGYNSNNTVIEAGIKSQARAPKPEGTKPTSKTSSDDLVPAEEGVIPRPPSQFAAVSTTAPLTDTVDDKETHSKALLAMQGAQQANPLSTIDAHETKPTTTLNTSDAEEINARTTPRSVTLQETDPQAVQGTTCSGVTIPVARDVDSQQLAQGTNATTVAQETSPQAMKVSTGSPATIPTTRDAQEMNPTNISLNAEPQLTRSKTTPTSGSEAAIQLLSTASASAAEASSQIPLSAAKPAVENTSQNPPSASGQAVDTSSRLPPNAPEPGVEAAMQLQLEMLRRMQEVLDDNARLRQMMTTVSEKQEQLLAANQKVTQLEEQNRVLTGVVQEVVALREEVGVLRTQAEVLSALGIPSDGASLEAFKNALRNPHPARSMGGESYTISEHPSIEGAQSLPAGPPTPFNTHSHPRTHTYPSQDPHTPAHARAYAVEPQTSFKSTTSEGNVRGLTNTSSANLSSKSMQPQSSSKSSRSLFKWTSGSSVSSSSGLGAQQGGSGAGSRRVTKPAAVVQPEDVAALFDQFHGRR